MYRHFVLYLLKTTPPTKSCNRFKQDCTSSRADAYAPHLRTNLSLITVYSSDMADAEDDGMRQQANAPGSPSAAQPEENDDGPSSPPGEGSSSSSSAAAPPPKATTAYFLFSNEQRPLVKADQPGLKITEVAKAIGERWKALTSEEKAVRGSSENKRANILNDNGRLRQKEWESCSYSLFASQIVCIGVAVLRVSSQGAERRVEGVRGGAPRGGWQ